MASAEALHAIGLVAALLRLIAERDPHPALFETAALIADQIDDFASMPQRLVRLEVAVLAEAGFGLDLARCAATGAVADLAYVSPKSGRAVSKAAGEPYKGRLLPLPGFLRDEAMTISPPPGEIFDGFRLTEFFLMRDLFEPRGLPLPQARGAYLAELAKRSGWSG